MLRLESVHTYYGKSHILHGVSIVVNPGEEAVVRRFGRVIRPRGGEGLHYRLPRPIERADKVNVSEIRREGIGVSPPEHGIRLHPPEEGKQPHPARPDRAGAVRDHDEPPPH